MVGYIHEVLVDMSGHAPGMVATLLGDALPAGIAVSRVRVESGEFSDHAPTQYRADRVLRFGRGRARLAVVLEVQLAYKPGKLWVWPAYLANLRARDGCPVVLVVLCLKRSVAARYDRPILLGPGSYVTPIVVGPDRVPVTTDPHEARQLPELAVLSAMVHHQHRRRVEVLGAAAVALAHLEPERRALYYDTLITTWPERSREGLREILVSILETYVPQSDFARPYYKQGKAEGKAEGMAEGEVRGEAKALLTVLESRGIDIPESARERVTACTDLGQLDAWLRRAASIDKIDELFD